MIGVTSCNLIFIDKSKNNNLFEIIHLNDPKVERGVRYFFGYDGTLISIKAGTNKEKYDCSEIMTVPWNSGFFSQPVSKGLRKFDNKIIKFTNLFLSITSTLIRRPFSTTKKIISLCLKKIHG